MGIKIPGVYVLYKVTQCQLASACNSALCPAELHTSLGYGVWSSGGDWDCGWAHHVCPEGSLFTKWHHLLHCVIVVIPPTHAFPEKRKQGPLNCPAKSLQSCLTLCDPIDGSPTGSPVPGILQARTLEWVVISFSNAWKWKVKSLSRVRPSATPWTAAFQAPPSMGFSMQEYWSGVPLPSSFT